MGLSNSEQVTKKRFNRVLIIIACFLAAVLSFAVSLAIGYSTGDMDAVSVGVILCFAFIICGVYLICAGMEKKNELYDPDSYTTERLRKRIEQAYREHRTEQESKKLLELELVPKEIIIGKPVHIDRMKALIAEKITDMDEFNKDYFEGELFKGRLCMLNIGKKYTIYCDTGKGQHIIENKDITAIAPYIQNVKVYTYGFFYSYTIQHFHIRIWTEDTCYTFKLDDYMDRPVMSAYYKILQHLNPACRLHVYPEE